jgi:hypothetical protein
MEKRTRTTVKRIMTRTENMLKDRKGIMTRKKRVRMRRMAKKNMDRTTQASTDKIYKLRINK